MTVINKIPKRPDPSPSNQATEKDLIFSNLADDKKIDIVSKSILQQNREKAYLELTK